MCVYIVERDRMKINKDIDNLIKNNYKGSIISFEEDIGRFFAVKRMLKKHLSKESLFYTEKNVKVMANHIYILFNLFNREVALVVFTDILEPEEYKLYQSVLFALGVTNKSINAEFEEFLKENL